MNDIQTMLTNEINLYFPNIIIQNLNVTPIEDQNTIQIYFRYSVALTNIEDEIQITFANANV